MTELTSDNFSLHIDRLDTGGWFIAKLSWNGRTITDQGASDFAAGWEVTLGEHRYTPHVAEVVTETIERCGDSDNPELILPHRTTDGSARILHHLRITNGALEQWLEIENLLPADLVVTNLNFAQLKLDPSFLAGLEVWHNYAQTLAPTVENYFELHDPAVVLHQPNGEWGIAVLNMAPGQTHRISTGNYTSIGYSNGCAPFVWNIPTGETFVSDRGVTLPYAGNSQPSIYTYIRSVLRADSPPLTQQVSSCSWEPFGRDINEAGILRQIDRAHELGIETYIIDDGWQGHTGDWQTDPVKFPNDLQPICDRLRQNNMHLGLWIGPTMMHEESAAFHEYNDCLLRNAQGDQCTAHVVEGELGIGCLVSRFETYIEAKLHSLVKRYDLRYLKIDLPVTYDVYHRPVVLCYATDHNHAPGHDYTLKAYRVVQNTAKRLKAAFPELVVDLTFEIWGGWHAIDPALVECADVCWLSNLSDATGSGSYGPAHARHLGAARSSLVPPEHLVVGNLRCNGPHPEESVASIFASYPMLLGDVSKVSEQDCTAQRAMLDWFKNERDSNDITAHFATVLELGEAIPSQQKFTGFARTDLHGNGILGIFRNLASSSQAVVLIDLPKGLADSTPVQLSDAQTQQVQTSTVGALRSGQTIVLDRPHAFRLFALRVISPG